jgi:hypothetical protein
MNLLEASRTNSRLDALTQLRDMLANLIDATENARDVAPLARQYQDVLKQIDELGGASKPEAKGSPLDELQARRAGRKSNAASGDGSEGEVVAR